MFPFISVYVSLRDKIRRGSGGADFPLPLAAIDTERERLILEKDEEVRLAHSLLHSLTHAFTHSEIITSHSCISDPPPPHHLVEEDAGGFGEDSGADAARPERRQLISHNPWERRESEVPGNTRKP